eukprot:Pgem_evm1s6790
MIQTMRPTWIFSLLLIYLSAIICIYKFLHAFYGKRFDNKVFVHYMISIYGFIGIIIGTPCFFMTFLKDEVDQTVFDVLVPSVFVLPLAVYVGELMFRITDININLFFHHIFAMAFAGFFLWGLEGVDLDYTTFISCIHLINIMLMLNCFDSASRFIFAFYASWKKEHDVTNERGCRKMVRLEWMMKVVFFYQLFCKMFGHALWIFTFIYLLVNHKLTSTYIKFVAPGQFLTFFFIEYHSSYQIWGIQRYIKKKNQKMAGLIE